jgi:DNA adenine methylase
MNPRYYQVFRYPGAKAKLVRQHYFQQMIHNMLAGKTAFYEAYLGSAAVSLWVALQYPTLEMHSVDLDPTISGFWQLVSEGTKGDVNDFVTLVERFPTIPNKVQYFYDLKAQIPYTIVERAWHGLFFNRTSFSGIALSQPIGGKTQESQWKIDCRYNAPLLVKKFHDLRTLLRGRMYVTTGECVDWLVNVPVNAALYLDPPYYVKGEQLYPMAMQHDDHMRLAKALKSHSNWLLSYDACPEIQEMYRYASIYSVDMRYSINGQKNQWVGAKEFLIEHRS